MHQRDSRSAIRGTAALKIDTRVSSAHIIQFPGSVRSSQQVNSSTYRHYAGKSRHEDAYIMQRNNSRLPYQAEPRATPAQTAGAITLFALLTIIAGIL